MPCHGANSEAELCFGAVRSYSGMGSRVMTALVAVGSDGDELIGSAVPEWWTGGRVWLWRHRG